MLNKAFRIPDIDILFKLGFVHSTLASVDRLFELAIIVGDQDCLSRSTIN